MQANKVLTTTNMKFSIVLYLYHTVLHHMTMTQS